MSELQIRAGAIEDLGVEVVAIPVLRSSDAEDGSGEQSDGWWTRAVEQVLVKEPPSGSIKASWAALGDPERPDLLVVHGKDEGLGREEWVRRAAGAAVRAVRDRGGRSVAFRPLPQDSRPDLWQAATEGLLLGDWSYDELRNTSAGVARSRPDLRTLWRETGLEQDLAGQDAAVRRGQVLAEVQNQVRELVAQPGNIVTPRFLADRASRLGEEHGLLVQAWGVEKLREAGFGGLLSVARGSEEEPRFIILEHTGEGGDPYVVVGKGVTFDAGGISLKPASGMEDMKYDMAGAAAVLGIMTAAGRLEIPQRVIGLIPATENLPSGTALKPGDVIRGESGTSIEVVNTDAEGRLILSDALSYSRHLGPRAVIDLATLTGGCVVALGHHAIGLMTTSDELSTGLGKAGTRTGERVWRLPLWPEYRRQIDSDIADLKNSAGRDGSPITAGAFLQSFVGDLEWAHLDIAGTAWADSAFGYQPKGATGVGMRLVLEWLRAAV
jgi:leucyl aminopeptidase